MDTPIGKRQDQGMSDQETNGNYDKSAVQDAVNGEEPSPARALPWTSGQHRAIVALVTLAALVFAISFFVSSAWQAVNYDDLEGSHATTSNAKPPASFRCDLNSASWPELAQLPGIGETLAKRIVARRESNGPYENAEQLQDIRGIGEKKLSQLVPFVHVDEQN